MLVLVAALAALVLFLIKSDRWGRWAAVGSTTVVAVVAASMWGIQDSLGYLFTMLVSIGMVLISLLTFEFPLPNRSAFWGWLLVLETALLGVFSAQHILIFYVFWELTLIPILFLMLQWGGKNRKAVTLKFFFYTLMASLGLLIVILALSIITGTWGDLEFSSIHQFPLPLNLQILALVLVGIACAVKAAVVPFHTWQADLYEEAPAPLLLVLAVLVSKMGLFGLIRFLPLMPIAVQTVGGWGIALGLVGMIYALGCALVQKSKIRVLAYASVAHMSMMAAAILTGNGFGLSGVIFQLVAHSSSVLIVLGCWVLISRHNELHQTSISGWVHHQPLLCSILFVGILSAVAFPLTQGFIGEWFMLVGLFYVHPVFAGLGVVSVILGAWVMLTFYKEIALGPKQAHYPEVKLSWKETLVLGVLVAMTFVFGVHPQLILNPILHHVVLFLEGLVQV